MAVPFPSIPRDGRLAPGNSEARFLRVYVFGEAVELAREIAFPMTCETSKAGVLTQLRRQQPKLCLW